MPVQIGGDTASHVDGEEGFKAVAGTEYQGQRKLDRAVLLRNHRDQE
ncbi:MAG: hypothetical protein VCE75_05130 [Alphaproteobacteria bacterium]